MDIYGSNHVIEVNLIKNKHIYDSDGVKNYWTSGKDDLSISMSNGSCTVIILYFSDPCSIPCIRCVFIPYNYLICNI